MERSSLPRSISPTFPRPSPRAGGPFQAAPHVPSHLLHHRPSSRRDAPDLPDRRDRGAGCSRHEAGMLPPVGANPVSFGKGSCPRHHAGLVETTFAREGWGVKSGNYLRHLEALRAARATGADEGIVLDDKGHVVSCAMGKPLVWLPSAKGLSLCRTGARSPSGYRASWVRHHTSVKNRSLPLRDLRRATALAVTNSRLGVMPVTLLDGKPVADPYSGRGPCLRLSSFPWITPGRMTICWMPWHGIRSWAACCRVSAEARPS